VAPSCAHFEPKFFLLRAQCPNPLSRYPSLDKESSTNVQSKTELLTSMRPALLRVAGGLLSGKVKTAVAFFAAGGQINEFL